MTPTEMMERIRQLEAEKAAVEEAIADATRVVLQSVASIEANTKKLQAALDEAVAERDAARALACAGGCHRKGGPSCC